MPRKLELSWDKSNKYWYKNIKVKGSDGKERLSKLYLGRGKWKYRDEEAYEKAKKKYEQYLLL